MRKLLLLSLFTTMSLVSALAQINVHGTVTNVNGTPEAGANILITAFFADSTAVFESEFTDAEGNYQAEIAAPPLNFMGFVQVSLVDCFGNVQTQEFLILTGNEDVDADFTYCQWVLLDSCAVYILEEWLPGTNASLNAWTPVNVPVTYLWNTGETTQYIYPQGVGEYCVTVTYPWGCTGTDCYMFSNDTTNNCFAFIVSTPNNDGTYDVEAVALGNAPFQYYWNTNDTTAVLDNVPAGTYCVTVSDITFCEYSTCIIIDDGSFCELWITEDPAGSLTAYNYGTAPFEYQWSNGANTQTIWPNGVPGTYCVTVTDANLCSAYSCYYYGTNPDSCYLYIIPIYTDSNTFALQAIGFSLTSNDTVSYLWNTGETTDTIYPQDPTFEYCVTMTTEGGCQQSACYEAANWCYAWINAEYIDTNHAILTVYSDPIFGGQNAVYAWSHGDSGQVITVNESGYYCVTATLSNLCETEACVYIDFDSLSTACWTWVTQYPDSSGQWYAEAVSWGYGNISYEWSNGDTTSIVEMDHPNEYLCVTMTTSLGCVAEACVDTFFNICQAYIVIDYPNANSAVLTAYNYYPNQNAVYAWSNGETGNIITVYQEGSYCVTVTGGGCISETCIDVVFWNNSCVVWISEDASSGAGVEYTANAWGTPPFTYLWSNGWDGPSQLIDFGIHDLCVTVTDATGCVAEACNFGPDSCYTSLWYDPILHEINIATQTPLWYTTWSTGDSSYTLPITTPGTYCVTVTDLHNCVSSACLTVDSLDQGTGTNVISGYVLADSIASLQGIVYAYELSSNTGAYELVDSAQIHQGIYYKFEPLPSGVYLLRAELAPNTPGYGEFMPTYHLSSDSWESADPHVLPNMLTVTTDIRMLSSDTTGGSGVIGGIVADPNQIIAGEGDDSRGESGVASVRVLLRDEYGQPLNYRVTLQDGSFRFTGLPFGTYRLKFDIPGIVSPEIWVTLSPESPEKLGVTLVIEGSVDVEEPTVQEVDLYPNPATEEITIVMPGSHADFHVRIIDMQGRVVHTGSQRSENGIMHIEIGQYTPGLYHINLKGETKSYFGRFIKQE